MTDEDTNRIKTYAEMKELKKRKKSKMNMKDTFPLLIWKLFFLLYQIKYE